VCRGGGEWGRGRRGEDKRRRIAEGKKGEDE